VVDRNVAVAVGIGRDKWVDQRGVHAEPGWEGHKDGLPAEIPPGGSGLSGLGPVWCWR